MEGEPRGYSIGREVAIDPQERYPEFVAMHEMAHILLGHTMKFPETVEEMWAALPALAQKVANEDLHEVEAHSVAIFAAGMAGVEFDMNQELDYLSYVLMHCEATDEHGERIAKVAGEILEAGL
ncbi:hypothetical protein DQP57_00250 [Mycobacterium colombiense]|uniref:IrrE N-terminal-like domain-containing protein n=2 Tax=Mycobacterium colombiense TaxID=339268 RepID=A0A329MD41_9MYCO|nr:hypothetical protein DQP57_00250 [Mycobacterium colombiense]